MATNKLEMSLDDIIKQGKKNNKDSIKSPTKRIQKSSAVGRPGQNLQRKRGNMIQKRRVNNRNNANSKANQISNRATNNRKKINNRRALTKAATTSLVRKLVKKALNQAVVSRPVRALPRRKGVINRIVKRQDIRANTIGLRRINQRSRVITRRPRVNILAQMARTRRARVQAPIGYTPVIETLPPVRRITYVPQRLVGGNNYAISNRRVRNNQVGQQRRNLQQSVRQQVRALRQATNRQQNLLNNIALTQRRQISSGNRAYNFVRRRQNIAFADPPNFLQRVPMPTRQNSGRNRKRRGIQF